MNINIILNKQDGTTQILYNGYNIIKTTIYNNQITNKILQLIKNELKNNDPDFDSLEKYLILK